MKDKSVIAVKAVISISLMAYLLFRFLSDPQDRQVLLTTLTTANYGYLLLGLALYVVAVITNAVKWYILLKAQGIPVPLRAVTNYTFVGFFFNNFLPANVGGDVMRGFELARYTERSAEAAVSVIVDRIIGLGAFMFTAVVAALIVVNVLPEGPDGNNNALTQNLVQVEVVSIIGLITISAGFVVLLSRRLRTIVGKVFQTPVLAPLAPVYDRISNAFAAYRYQYSAIFWAFCVGVVTVLLTGVVDIAIVAGLHGTIPPLYIFLFNPIIAVSLIAPVSIGGLGAMSAFYIYFYGLVGVPQTLAFALSLVKQAITYLGSVPGGILWLLNRGKSRAAIDQPEERAREVDNLVDVSVKSGD